MRLTKYTHACVRLDDGDRALVIDPGGWRDTEPQALAGADAVLVTHHHKDHVDHELVIAQAAANPRLRIWTTAQAAEGFHSIADRVVVVEPGERFDANGFGVRAHGGRHAAVHIDYPVVPNIGFLVNDAVYHPGDCLAVPDAAVDTLLVPVQAGWLKIAEAVDFMRAVRPGRAHPIHDGFLNDVGNRSADRHLSGLGRADYSRLPVGESRTIG